ncbi:VTT domain-containing protein [Chloroflexota bacterium]
MVFTIASCAVLVYYWEVINELQQYGYLGAFLIALIAGSSLPIPLSYVVLTFTLGGILSPAVVGATSGLGAGLGGTLVFLSGRGGSRFLPKLHVFSPDVTEEASSFKARMLSWAHRRGSIVVFLMSAVFNPIFAPMALTMGAIRFNVGKFFLMCWAGNTVKSMIIAYCGYYGLSSLIKWIG